MNPELKPLLEYLSNVLEADRQADIDALHQRALNWQPVDRLPVVMTYPAPSEALPFRSFPHAEALRDPEKMLFNELVLAFNTSIASRGELDDDLPCTLRPNFGTILVASLFGARVEQVDNNPPWVLHDSACDVSLDRVLDQDPLDVSRGWCPRVADAYACFHRVLDNYPELKKMIRIVLPDLQGPFDNLELIRGSDLFAELHADPERVAKALGVVATAQIAVAQHLKPHITDGPAGYAHQHATLIRGHILLRNDSVIMMSPEMYREQVAPHDERVLRALGGGGIHSCGKIQHHAEALMDLASIRCLDLGQPALNDLDAIYALAKTKRVPLVRIAVSEDELVSGHVMRRFPTGVTLRCAAASVAEAKRIMTAYRRATAPRSSRSRKMRCRS